MTDTRGSLSRRTFLSTSGALALTSAVGPNLAGAQSRALKIGFIGAQ